MKNLLRLSEKLLKFIKLSNHNKFEFIKAYLYTGYFRIYILFFPYRKLKNKFGKAKEESNYDIDPKNYYKVIEIRNLVAQVSKYTLWKSECLVQALTAQKLLKHCGIKSTLYLGVRKNSENGINAHAWVRCGRIYVSGSNNKLFTVVAKFCS